MKSLILVALFTACGSPPATGSTTPPPEVESEEAPAAASPDGRVPNARERAAIASLAAIAERARGLEFRSRFDIRVQTSEEILAHLFAEFDEEDLAVSRKVYTALGLLPPDLDIRDLLTRVLGEQVAGYYDPEIDRLVIRDDVMRSLGTRTLGMTDEGKLTIVHELVHALQDQHFGLDDLDEEEDSDPSTAYQAVVEGDATLAMVGYAAEQNRVPLQLITGNPENLRNLLAQGEADGDNAELQSAPAILRVTLLSSYVDGLVFCATIHGQGGWPSVDRAHRQRPVSTEQILHPEKFLQGELPDRVEVPENLVAGWNALESDRLGELEMRVYFGQLQNDVDEPAAAGWNGDHLRAYEHPDGRVAVVWFSTWDNEAEASEAEIVAKRIRQANSDPELQLVARRNRALLIVRGLGAAEREAAANAFEAFARTVPPTPARDGALSR
ncbi:MAG: hypothetical protein AAGF12_36475 [Myxococcota bacterium]